MGGAGMWRKGYRDEKVPLCSFLYLPSLVCRGLLLKAYDDTPLHFVMRHNVSRTAEVLYRYGDRK